MAPILLRRRHHPRHRRHDRSSSSTEIQVISTFETGVFAAAAATSVRVFVLPAIEKSSSSADDVEAEAERQAEAERRSKTTQRFSTVTTLSEERRRRLCLRRRQFPFRRRPENDPHLHPPLLFLRRCSYRRLSLDQLRCLLFHHHHPRRDLAFRADSNYHRRRRFRHFRRGPF